MRRLLDAKFGYPPIGGTNLGWVHPDGLSRPSPETTR